MKPIVIHHSADYDGIFCREIARKFLPDAELFGWDYGDRPICLDGHENRPIYILDLSPECLTDTSLWSVIDSLIWIDHHKTAIEKFSSSIAGYRIDGVAACRLTWQWFGSRAALSAPLPDKQAFIERAVEEPLAVRLAGEYDIWDHRGDGDIEFQFGLDCQKNIPWTALLAPKSGREKDWTNQIIADGSAAMQCYAKRDADIMRTRSFIVDWEGLKFLALTTARCNSNTFAARDVPETGHDALMAFFYNGIGWTVSLYHANNRKDIDLSLIAAKYGGGGHRGACGFRTDKLPFL